MIKLKISYEQMKQGEIICYFLEDDSDDDTQIDDRYIDGQRDDRWVDSLDRQAERQIDMWMIDDK